MRSSTGVCAITGDITVAKNTTALVRRTTGTAVRMTECECVSNLMAHFRQKDTPHWAVLSPSGKSWSFQGITFGFELEGQVCGRIGSKSERRSHHKSAKEKGKVPEYFLNEWLVSCQKVKWPMCVKDHRFLFDAFNL